LAEVILGYGRTKAVCDKTENLQLQMVVAPFGEDKKPIYSEARLEDINISDLSGLPFRGILELDDDGRCVSILLGAEKSGIKTFSFNPANYPVTQLRELPEAASWFKRYKNDAFQELGYMNVLIARGIEGESKPFVIPSVVTAQYYLCHSQLLRVATKQIPFITDLYDENRSNLKPPNVQIKLRDNVPRKIAAHLARYLIDSYANKRLTEIHRESMHKSGGGVASFYMKPPVDQMTDWTVKCVDVNGAYWVVQIICCTSAFPFKKLHCVLDKIVFYGEGEIKKRRQRKKEIAQDPKLVLAENSDADSKETEIDSVIFSYHPGLQRVEMSSEVEKIPKKRKNKISFLLREVQISISTGPNGFGFNVLLPGHASISNTGDDFPEQLDDSFDDKLQQHRLLKFHALIVFLQEQYKVELLILPDCHTLEPESKENVIPFDASYLDNPWCRKHKIIARENTALVRKWKEVGRRFYLVKCTTADFIIYIIEFVPGFSLNDSASTLLLFSTNEIKEKEISAEINLYCTKRKDWPGTSIDRKFLAEKIYHNDNETEAALASRILRLGQKIKADT
jgi:hypothetical protein